jgi:2-haloacid dehalogenase
MCCTTGIGDRQRLDWFLDHVVTKRWHYQHDAGRPLAETVPELVAAYPGERALIELYGPRWLETIPGPMPGTHAIVEELAEAGVPLFAITNFGAEFWRMFRPTAPIFDLFRDIIVSGEERLMKPDPAIWALAEQRFGVSPAEILFIDDNPANVAGAAAAGWHVHRFIDAGAARASLVSAGLLPRPA